MDIEKIVIGSDHAGFDLKEYIKEILKKDNYEVCDIGTHDRQRVDYPLIARDVASQIQKNSAQKGILICGSGLGVAICANKVKGVRAVTCHDTYSARMSRAHNNANVLTLGARVIGPDLACEIVKAWLTSQFEGGRHQRRVDMIENY